MNINFPGGDAALTTQGRPRVVQRLAPGLAPNIAIGSRVERGQPLNDDASGATAVTISMAERLHASPKDVESLLSRPIGSRFQSGEEIAHPRKGLRGQTVLAPFTGILQTYNPTTGIALFTSSAIGAATALVSGAVEVVEGDSLSIRTSGSRLFGIIGFGRDGSGPIRFVSLNPSHVVDPAEIANSLRGAVVVAGPWVSAGAYKRFVEVGVAAVVSSGFAEREIAAAFNLPAEARIGAWRGSGMEIASPIAVIATEGFGQLPMHPAMWSFLREQEGREAIVTTRTEVGDRLTRPQLIVEEPARSATTGSDIRAGSKLRLVDHSNFGLAVDAAGAPAATRFENGRAIKTIDVVLPNRKIQTVPTTNAELIA